MADGPSDERDDRDPADGNEETAGTLAPAAVDDPERAESLADLRDRVERSYDFDAFGPADMAEMSVAEWEAAFDADTWITGTQLLDRVQADLESRVASRDVFAVVEREADPDCVLAYSDRGYARVYADGSVEGEGTVFRDAKPSVALASMDDYEVPDPPADPGLPAPESIGNAGSSVGNTLLLAVAVVQLLAGVVLLLGSLFYDPLLAAACTPTSSVAYTCGGVHLHVLGRSVLVAVVAGFGFLVFGGFLAAVVANARLSDRFRAAEYRDRLRAAGVGTDARPDLVPDATEGRVEGAVDETAAERHSPALGDEGGRGGRPRDGS